MRGWVLLVLGTLAAGCGGKTVDDADPSDASGDAVADGGADATPDAPEPSLVTCTGPGQCALVSVTCCGTCSVPTLADYTAVHRDQTAKHYARVCGPEPFGCPPCVPIENDDSLQAWCRFSTSSGGGGRPAGTCTAVDVREEPVSACETDADCVLRHSPCCEPCEATRDDLVALNPASMDAYRREVCAGGEGCPKCATSYPSDARASCNPKTKHCEVTWRLVGG